MAYSSALSPIWGSDFAPNIHLNEWTHCTESHVWEKLTKETKQSNYLGILISCGDDYDIESANVSLIKADQSFGSKVSRLEVVTCTEKPIFQGLPDRMEIPKGIKKQLDPESTTHSHNQVYRAVYRLHGATSKSRSHAVSLRPPEGPYSIMGINTLLIKITVNYV